MTKHALASDPPHLRAMLSVLGLSEADNNPEVLAMYAVCGHPEIKSTSVPWCAAGVGWALVQAGLPTSKPVSQNLLAASYLKYPGQRFTKNDVLPRGAIAVWPRDAGSGHVNFVLRDLGDGRVQCIGCNQANGAGGGVTIVTYSKSQLRTAILPVYPTAKPAPVPVPQPVDPEPEIEPEQPSTPADDPKAERLPWWKRIRNRVLGWGSGLGGFGILGGLTDWQVALVTFGAVFLLIALVWFIIRRLFTLEEIRAFIRKAIS